MYTAHMSPCWIIFYIYRQRWARNFKNVAPQKQNVIYKTRAKDTKRNCAFETVKVYCAATINAKNISFHKNFLKSIFNKIRNLHII
jgi:hypothetical protein